MEKMKVFVASDHGGWGRKEMFKTKFSDTYDIKDVGNLEFDIHDDYPDFIIPAAQAVAQTAGSLGIVLGGSGNGEAMAANKCDGVRCSLFHGLTVAKEAVDKDGRMSDDPYEVVKLAKLHNNANMLSLGGRFLTDEEAMEAIRVFLETPYIPEERHDRRLEKITQFEQQRS